MEAREERKNKNTDYVVGFDITDRFSQVSIGSLDSEEVKTVTGSAQGTSYLIPTALFKRSEVNQWFAGEDAVRYKDADGFFVDRLIEKARKGEDVQVGNNSFRPSALLALFMKRTLTAVNSVVAFSNISCLMITVEVLDDTLISMLSEAVLSLGLKTKEVYFQTHMESFYNYVLFQPHELWVRDVLLFDATAERMKYLRMECNHNTTPIVCLIDSGEQAEFTQDKYKTSEAAGLFTDFVEKTIEGHMVTSTYLIGDEFKNEWCREGVGVLCRKGRVFQGNNLYSKGAAYSARNRLNPTPISLGHAFLGNEKLKANFGINITDRGEKSYLPLLDGGINWFEAANSCELILNQGNKVTFLVTPLTGKNPATVDITLGDLPKRPPKTTRIHIDVKMQSETQILVTIRDLGFGELFPASNIVWNEVISI